MATRKNIVYAPLGWMLKGLARLPLGVLYGVADGLYFVAYRVVGYRKATVRKNLAESFPEMTEAARRDIERKFYRHLADYMVETVKLLHISDDEMKRRMIFEGMEQVDEILRSGRSITAYFSHSGNWEWVPSITLWSSLQAGKDAEFCQVYRPLKNKWFDNLFLKLRSRFRPLSFPKQTVLRDLLYLRRDRMPSITGFMSDQKPSHGDPTHIVKFLNHPTAMITGTETLTRRLDMAAVYLDLEKLSRGHYKVTIRMIDEHPASLPPMELTERYARLLETTIRRNPSIWLWSHKRWKNPVEMPDEKTESDEKRH